MELTREERAILRGARGAAARQVLHMQADVGEFFGAAAFVQVTGSHVMAEIESMGEAGLAWVEDLAEAGGSFAIPTTTNARSVDFAGWERIQQDPAHVGREFRLSAALQRMGAILTDTCVNYQTIAQPAVGEHVAWGDTGAVIYANSALGARSNFEGGPAAIAAGITGRVPSYGYHLDEQRTASLAVRVADRVQEMSDWDALGAVIGGLVGDYWRVPALTGIRVPGGDAFKRLGAAMASYGSVAMFHVVGQTPEGPDLDTASGRRTIEHVAVEPGALRRFYEQHEAVDQVDVVVFSAPQLSILELRTLSQGLSGKHIHEDIQLLVTTNHQNCALAERLGYRKAIEDAGGMVISGTCFYLMTPRELAATHGWQTILTDSAKLSNIIQGYGYRPIFRPTSVCLETAITGRLSW